MILNFAGSRNSFTLCELSDYVRSREVISDSGILWHIKKLIMQNKLSRLSRGLYGAFVKKEFAPILTDELKQLYEDISSDFPLIDVAVYSGHDITSLQHHLSANNALYVEVTKEASEVVFHSLIDKKIKVYHKPDSEFMCNYVDLSEHCVIVKPLVTESPLKKIEGIYMPTLEKLLVDINADPDFYCLQGVEASYIMDNARSLYQLNTPKMLRYASRRGIREKMQSYLTHDN
ncbi:MAG: hypothetical protein K2K93_07640 [Muribaculaceae bacterium]|nr:hypothetical protein [Muribaculaceae bacterium]